MKELSSDPDKGGSDEVPSSEKEDGDSNTGADTTPKEDSISVYTKFLNPDPSIKAEPDDMIEEEPEAP